MTENTVTEKDMFLQTFERECQTTLRMLQAMPAHQSEFKPHERSRTARDLAWTFVIEQAVAEGALKGALDFSKPMPEAPTTLTEVIRAFEAKSRETAQRVTGSNETELNRMVAFPSGPGKMGQFRGMDLLWMTLMDQVHHRGQLSVYVRMTGGKVPSIYGPTADEPWM